ncbi:hypothetical protein [Nocardia mangyaensis]|uniref:hypothetical protein n=1 Tax=Nocardia mangyaensis TaxID=2213200 RepID=UPI002676C955|nr:hypothetical protein [Nocardia mangyaensis]MDO3649315.1 hypothetical protein [Nocardia mangyaensis]
MHPDQSPNTGETPAIANPPLAAPPLAPPMRRTRRVVIAALVGVVLLAAAGAVTGYLVTRPDPIVLAIGDCVGPATVAELACDEPEATHRIMAREPLERPDSAACMKHDAATRAERDTQYPDVVLCLEPTRNANDDPGSLRQGDCVEVSEKGTTARRVPCTHVDPIQVLSTELHATIPATDRACAEEPETRLAFGLTSLGGRGIVICARYLAGHSKTAEVGECVAKFDQTPVPCDAPEAMYRVLDGRVEYQDPGNRACAGIRNSQSSYVHSSSGAAFYYVQCSGPVATDHIGYGTPGDCATDVREPLQPKVTDCSDPAADHLVTEVHDVATDCGTGWVYKFVRNDGATNGLTVCVAPR